MRALILTVFALVLLPLAAAEAFLAWADRRARVSRPARIIVRHSRWRCPTCGREFRQSTTSPTGLPGRFYRGDDESDRCGWCRTGLLETALRDWEPRQWQ